MLKKLLPFLVILSCPAFAGEAPLVCGIRLDFTTRTVGIDSKTYAKIMDAILKNPAITEKHAENLGKAGERTLCLTVKPEELDKTYDALRAFIPEESKDFVTGISAENGRHFTSRPPAKFQRNEYSK